MSKVPETTVLRYAHHERRIRRQRIAKGLGFLSLFSLVVVITNILPLPTLPFRIQTTSRRVTKEWRDDVWPLRDQTPWDISTDFPHPRKLEYNVTEGTWLRLDVHPTTGDIVFDMIGDVYCIPGAEIGEGSRVTARPVLRGVPYDSDPHFSPTGDRLVYRSDAELGVENIWVMEWKGCSEMDVEGLVAHHGETPRQVRLREEGRLGGAHTFDWSEC